MQIGGTCVEIWNAHNKSLFQSVSPSTAQIIAIGKGYAQSYPNSGLLPCSSTPGWKLLELGQLKANFDEALQNNQDGFGVILRGHDGLPIMAFAGSLPVHFLNAEYTEGLAALFVIIRWANLLQLSSVVFEGDRLNLHNRFNNFSQDIADVGVLISIIKSNLFHFPGCIRIVSHLKPSSMLSIFVFVFPLPFWAPLTQILSLFNHSSQA